MAYSITHTFTEHLLHKELKKEMDQAESQKWGILHETEGRKGRE